MDRATMRERAQEERAAHRAKLEGLHGLAGHPKAELLTTD